MIADNIKRLRDEIPAGVTIIAAAKTRTPEEISEATAAGITVIGENYVQEFLQVRERVAGDPRWHFIGHLQTNKVKKIVGIIDLIQTVDSLHLAQEIDKRSAGLGKVMPILIEINSGREPQKAGVSPPDAGALIRELAPLPNLSIQGLMTMGPLAGDPEDARPYFVVTRDLFEKLGKSPPPGVEMRFLSMGMTNSYRVAIEEGSNMVRIGTGIFGPR
ncbi:MAG: YggS family pyridoxal phosphate-dependent enzyme [PVC group bacterium]